MFTTLIRLMGVMFFLMLAGVVLRYKKIVTAEGKRCLTDLILYLILPCNIIKAFSTNLGDHMISRFSILLAVAAASQLLALAASTWLYRRMGSRETPVFQYATVCSNSGFIGNPLAEGVFGITGLMYASIFLLPQRIVMWTAGISFFNRDGDRKEAYKKVIRHPCMVATYLGFAIMLFHIPLPSVIDGAILSVSACCTPMTMMYMGMILAEADIRKLIDKRQIYYCMIRLVALPLVLYIGCRLVRMDPLITGVCVLLTGMPAGSTTSLLASKYGADEDTATKCVVLSTALSIITIPIWSAVLSGQII